MSAAARLATLLVLLGILLSGLPQRVDAATGEICCRSQCCCSEPAAESCCGAADGAAGGAKLVSACDCGGSHDQVAGPVRHVTWIQCPPRSGVRAPQPARPLARREEFPRDAWAQSPEPPVPRRVVG